MRGVHVGRLAGAGGLQLVEGLAGVAAFVPPAGARAGDAFRREVVERQAHRRAADFHRPRRAVAPAEAQAVLVLGRDVLLLDEIGEERALASTDAVGPFVPRDGAADRPAAAEGVRCVGPLPAAVTELPSERSAGAKVVGVVI